MNKTILFAVVFSAAVISTFPAADASASGTVVKAPSSDSVYYVSAGKRWVFPNAATYLSWYQDWSGVTAVTSADLASMPIAGNVTYRPGAKLVKVQTDPKTYAVDRGGVLRWVTSESVAKELYGDDWGRQVDDIPDIFFTNYTVGEPISARTDFNLSVIMSGTFDIGEDKGHAAASATVVVPVSGSVSILASDTSAHTDAASQQIRLDWSSQFVDQINGHRAQSMSCGQLPWIPIGEPILDSSGQYRQKWSSDRTASTVCRIELPLVINSDYSSYVSSMGFRVVDAMHGESAADLPNDLKFEVRDRDGRTFTATRSDRTFLVQTNSLSMDAGNTDLALIVSGTFYPASISYLRLAFDSISADLSTEIGQSIPTISIASNVDTNLYRPVGIIP